MNFAENVMNYKKMLYKINLIFGCTHRGKIRIMLSNNLSNEIRLSEIHINYTFCTHLTTLGFFDLINGPTRLKLTRISNITTTILLSRKIKVR
jgi:hypothetical protein